LGLPFEKIFKQTKSKKLHEGFVIQKFKKKKEKNRINLDELFEAL